MVVMAGRMLIKDYNRASKQKVPPRAAESALADPPTWSG